MFDSPENGRDEDNRQHFLTAISAMSIGEVGTDEQAEILIRVKSGGIRTPSDNS
jgi:hypothetical protein